MAINLRKSPAGAALSRIAVEFEAGPDARGIGLAAMLLDSDGRPSDRDALVFRERPRSVDGAVRLVQRQADDSLEIDLSRIKPGIAEVALCVSSIGAIDKVASRPSLRGVARIYDLVEGVQLSVQRPEIGAGGLMREIGRLTRAQGSWHYIESDAVYRDGVEAMHLRHVDTLEGLRVRDEVVPVVDAETAYVAKLGIQKPFRYCDVAEREALVLEGVRGGLDRLRAETVVDLELERAAVANEAVLLGRLEAVLRRFTDKDRRLDDKERRDALQLACRAAPGFAEGLRHDVADRFVTGFCRERGVKVRVGLLRWAVP